MAGSRTKHFDFFQLHKFLREIILIFFDFRAQWIMRWYTEPEILGSIPSTVHRSKPSLYLSLFNIRFIIILERYFFSRFALMEINYFHIRLVIAIKIYL